MCNQTLREASCSDACGVVTRNGEQNKRLWDDLRDTRKAAALAGKQNTARMMTPSLAANIEKGTKVGTKRTLTPTLIIGTCTPTHTELI